MTLPWLNPNDNLFPPVARAMPDGLLAAGGDLSADRLITAYRQGIFPWFNSDSPILWWSPDPRLVLIPAHFKCSKSLAKTLRKATFEVRLNTAFTEVMAACAAPRRDTGDADPSATWIHPEMITAYQRLHELGHAHSIECWQNGKLVGGLYGVAIGRVFFGESMFSFVTDSSKVALATLCQYFTEWDIELIDCQIHSAHLARLGAVEVSRDDFISSLGHLCSAEPATSAWSTDYVMEIH